MSDNNVSIKSVLFCEEVRTEINHKLIVIGLYTTDMNVPVFPFQTRITFLMPLFVPTKGQNALEIDLVIEPEPMPVLGFKLAISTDRDNLQVMVHTPPADITLGQEGVLVLRQKQDDKFVEIARMPVNRISPIVSPLPPSQSQPAAQVS